MWELTSVKPQYYIIIVNKGPSSQGYGFSRGHVRMWELDYKESWAPKKCCVWTVVLQKTLLRVLWTARRSNQSFLKEINPGHSLEGLMLKLKLQYLGHLMGGADSFEKTLMLGKTEGRRKGEKGMTEDEMVGWHHPSTQWTWVWVNPGSWWRTGRPGCAVVHGIAKSSTWLSDWTELNYLFMTPAKIVRIVFYYFIKASLFTTLWKAELTFIILKAKQQDKNNCICFRGPNTWLQITWRW